MVPGVSLHEELAALVASGLSPYEAIRAATAEAARFAEAESEWGTIEAGARADLVIVDINRDVEVRDEMIHTRPGWSLLSGHRIKGWPVLTMLRGRVIAEWPDDAPRARVVGEPFGHYLPRKARSSSYKPMSR